MANSTPTGLPIDKLQAIHETCNFKESVFSRTNLIVPALASVAPLELPGDHSYRTVNRYPTSLMIRIPEEKQSGNLSYIPQPVPQKHPTNNAVSCKRKQKSILDTFTKAKSSKQDLMSFNDSFSSTGYTLTNPSSSELLPSNIESASPFQITDSTVVLETVESNVNAPIGSSSNSSHNESDIGNFYKNIQSLSDCQKYHLLAHRWTPSSSHSFALNSWGRRFQFKWLTTFNWLCYSKLLDGALCINCVLFGGEATHNASKLRCLFKLPYNHWRTAVKRFNDHQLKSPIHQTSTLRATEFKARMEGKANPIDAQLNNMVSTTVATNRRKLIPIVEAIMLCGRQNISLRAYRDDSQHYGNPRYNPGNFQAVLKYLEKCGSNALFQEHLVTAPRSATYKSKTTQNEIIRICGRIIQSSITKEIVDAKYFSVLVDEASDISNQEQMSLVIRFVDGNSLIRESFLGFYVCSGGLSGQVIAENILQALNNLGLDVNFCRGQGYDGAGNMAGRINGASSIIQREHPKALYVHCKSHILNLCIASSCKLQMVNNMMGQVRVVSEFFNAHPKRFDHLKDKVESLIPKVRHKRLLDVCKTRWIARIDGLDVFVEVFEAVVACLASIKTNVSGSWNSDSVRDANSLLYATLSFEFIICLVIVSRLLEVTRPLTKQLQSPTIDVIASTEKVTLPFTMLKKLREEIKDIHNVYFNEAVKIANIVGTSPSYPRIAGRQQNRANTQANCPSDYYRRVITVPFLDHLVSEIENRFSQQNRNVLNCFYGLPPAVVSNANWLPNFEKYLSMYIDDLPEPRYLSTELKMWETKWKMSQGALPSSLAAVLPVTDKITFPNLYVALQIAAIIPVTSRSCERSISVLRRLKTYLRNTMGQERMNGLVLLNIHREIEVDCYQVIDMFARENPRRMKLRDILS